jgi:hypothetical protein
MCSDGDAPFKVLLLGSEDGLTEPWRSMVMSDVVWKYIGWDRVIAILSHARGPTVIARLQEEVWLAGSGRFQDDFNVVLLEAPTEEGKRDDCQ